MKSVMRCHMDDKTTKQKATGYDRFIDWKLFLLPLGALFILLLIPTPKSMLDVGVEYKLGGKYVMKFFSQQLFQKAPEELSQWEIQMVRMMKTSVDKAAFTYKAFLKRDKKWCEKYNIPTTDKDLEKVIAHAQTFSEDEFQRMLKEGLGAKHNLRYDQLSLEDQQKADQGGFRVKAGVGIVLFVVLCFLTEAIPLPTVMFFVGIFSLIIGVVDRETIAGLYWSDATWFIMGSLMFSVAFVKTGIDRRIALMMFGRLKNPNLKWITLVIIVVISPLTMFMSDHALAAMFLPIGILLYTTTTLAFGKEDRELAKMIMITIAMACNLGGSLVPSGAARNIIMMSYAEEMFGVSIGFGEWSLYCIPFLFFVVPLTWIAINWRFKPEIKDLSPAMRVVREQVFHSGGKWSRQQILSIIIFVVTLFSWVTEQNLILKLTGIRFGIGVLAVMGALAYILAGIVNWRDYQRNVDWGVVWLYAGAVFFGKVLVDTGSAYWIARTFLELVAPLGLNAGLGLLLTGNVIIGLVTQLMADGPACAAVGPITLSMAGIVHPGTSMIPFMAMTTAVASSLAYCLVIGTPPNAIVYASGYLEGKDFLRVGLILWFTNLGVLMLLSATYWIWMGWSSLPSF